MLKVAKIAYDANLVDSHAVLGSTYRPSDIRPWVKHAHGYHLACLEVDLILLVQSVGTNWHVQKFPLWSWVKMYSTRAHQNQQALVGPDDRVTYKSCRSS